MDWSRGYSAHWRVFEVNPNTWADAGLLANVTTLQVERSCDGTAPLLESGSIDIDSPIGEDFQERYLRIAMTAEQDGSSERVDVVTLLCTATGGTVDYGFNEQSLDGRSVLYPASVKRVLTGSYAPKGADGAEWAKNALEEAITAPVQVNGSFTLDTNVVFDVGKSYLECVWQVLDAGNFCMTIQGNGTVVIQPIPSTPDLMLDNSNAKLLHHSIDQDLDFSDIPNAYTAIEEFESATVENNDSASETSIISRGYIHDVVDTSPTRVNGETLAQYVRRRLQEESTVKDTRTYKREYFPGVLPFSIVRGSAASVGMDGDLRIISQSLTCDKGITVNEKAAKEVRTWTA